MVYAPSSALTAALFKNAGVPNDGINIAVHIPTGAPCQILRRTRDQAFCNFGSRANPFTWVVNAELRSIQ